MKAWPSSAKQVSDPDRTRTCNLTLKRRLLCQLSYGAVRSKIIPHRRFLSTFGLRRQFFEKCIGICIPRLYPIHQYLPNFTPTSRKPPMTRCATFSRRPPNWRRRGKQKANQIHDIKLVKIKAGDVEPEGDLGLPEGAKGIVVIAHGSGRPSRCLSRQLSITISPIRKESIKCTIAYWCLWMDRNAPKGY